MGFRVIILWECEIEKDLNGTMERVVAELGAPFNSKTHNPTITP